MPIAVSLIANHQHPISQILHYITHLFAIAAVVFLFYDWRLTLLDLVLIQVFALCWYAFFEKNEPTFRTYPGIPILAELS
jgi:hypothetical protein